MTKLKLTLVRVSPWAGVAVVLAATLLGYFLVQGGRYVQASREVPSLNKDIERIQRSITLINLQLNAASTELEETQAEWQESEVELRILFGDRSAESLMAIVASAALAANVELTSMNPEDHQDEVLGNLQYRVQALTMSLEGGTSDIYRFLSLVQANVPAVSVANIRLANPDSAPSVQLELLFYSSPTVVDEDPDEGTG